VSLTPEQRNEVIALIGQYGANRRGTVLSYQPQPPMAKVMLQPENIETGWLPVLSPWVGNGWGLVIPLAQGDQVLLVCEEGDGQNFAIKGRYYSDVNQAPGTQPVAGEMYMQSESGSRLYFQTGNVVTLAAGTINLQAPGGGNTTVAVEGVLHVSGEVYRGYGTGDQVSLGGHTHDQPADSAGNYQYPTNAPNAGT